MAKSYGRLGATVVVANTDTALYTVPASTSAVVSEITICNIGSSQRTFRFAHVDGAIGDVSNEDYKYYDTSINGNTSLILNIGLAMATTETILVRASHAEVVFSCSGVEIS
jgi:hypothetical protein